MHWILWLGTVPLLFGFRLIWKWTVRDFATWPGLSTAYRRALPLRLLIAVGMILVGLYMVYAAVQFSGGERNAAVSKENYVTKEALGTPPPIPPISKPGQVVDWFLRYDSKISDYRLNYPEGLPDLKADILTDLESSNDAATLEARFDSTMAQYDEVLAQASARYEVGGPVGGESQEDYAEIMHAQAYLSAKIRVLGYFLLNKYGIQPE